MPPNSRTPGDSADLKDTEVEGQMSGGAGAAGDPPWEDGDKRPKLANGGVTHNQHPMLLRSHVRDNPSQEPQELGQAILQGAQRVAEANNIDQHDSDTSCSLDGSCGGAMARSHSPKRGGGGGGGGGGGSKTTPEKKKKREVSARTLCRYGDKCYTKCCPFGHPNKEPKFIPKHPKKDKKTE